MNKLMTDKTTSPCDSCPVGWATYDKDGCESCGDTCDKYKRYIDSVADKLVKNIFKGVKYDV